MENKSLKNALEAALRKCDKKGKKLPAEQPLVPIELDGNQSQRHELAHIVNEMCKAPSGKMILEAAVDAGYTLCFDESTQEEGIYGFAEPCDRICALNPDNTIEESIVTMAHELRHAFQFEQPLTEKINITNHDTKTKIHLDRIMEADAESYGCLVAWDLKTAGFPKAWDDFSGEFPEVSDPFEKEINNGKGRNEARTAAFLGWYDNVDRRDSYDLTYVEELKSIKPADFNKKLKSRSAEEIIKSLCHDMDDSSYFTADPALLESGIFVTVYADTKSKIKKHHAKRELLPNRIPDSSIDQLETIVRPKKKGKGKAVSAEARKIVFHNKHKSVSIAVFEKGKTKPQFISLALKKAQQR